MVYSITTRRRLINMYEFYGRDKASPAVRELYARFLKCWCAETCAERMRPDWSEENPTLGQCSITSFIVQDLLGGRVFGVPLPEGGFHCYNVVGGVRFDLTSEQFGERAADLDYTDRYLQRREIHFRDPDKKRRYELLKQKLLETEP